MKKITMLTLLTGSLLFGATADKSMEKFSKQLDSIEKTKDVKGFLQLTKQELPSVAEVITNYYETKYCTKDFDKKITISDIRNFANSKQYGFLTFLKIKNEDLFSKTINNYNFLNCGFGQYVN